MRKAKVLYKDAEAGILTQHDDGSFTFRYHDDWVAHQDTQSISLNFPKEEKLFHSPYLFSFFYNMLPEGTNKLAVCSWHRLDLDDEFGILMATTQSDSIGAVRVMKLKK